MKAKTMFYCTACGNETPKWAGRCPACGAWNTVVEQPEPVRTAGGKTSGKAAVRAAQGVRRACPVTDLQTAEEIRFPTGMGELDRVLGGGAVKGSLVLVGGAPGIGKSTLMLQICSKLCETSKVLYVSGEESEHQLKLRAKRLRVENSNLYVISETCLEDLMESVAAEQPDILIVDSIQTLYNDALDSPAGSISQVKGTSTPHTASCGRLKTASAPPMRSAFLRCRTRAWRRWRTPRRCCSPAARTTRPAPASPA